MSYLEQWFSFFNGIAPFDWILLSDRKFVFNDISDAFTHFISTNAKERDQLFKEVVEVRQLLQQLKGTDFEKASIDEKWCELFRTGNFVQLKKVVGALLSIFCSNSYCESVFSVINSVWTKEKSQLSVHTLNALVAMKCNCDFDCRRMYEHLLGEKELLREAKKSGKYDL